MPMPYFVGDEIPLEFTAKDKNGSGPSSSTVSVYDQANAKVVDEAAATVASTTVSYNVAEGVTDSAGQYRAIFTLIFTGTITRRHEVGFLIEDSSLRRNTYGHVSGVEALVGDLVSSRTFTDSTVPSYTQVQTMLDAVASEMNVELEQNGYAAPPIAADDPNAYRLCVHANNAGAAARVLSMLPMESYVFPDETRTGGDRREMLDRELWHFIQRVRRQEFPATRSDRLLKNLYSGSAIDRDTSETKKPLFTRAGTDFPSSRSLTES